MSKQEEKQHWEREWDMCVDNPHYFFQEYYVVKKIHELEEAEKCLKKEKPKEKKL